MSARPAPALNGTRRGQVKTPPPIMWMLRAIVATLYLGSVGAHGQTSPLDPQVPPGAEPGSPDSHTSASVREDQILPPLELGDDIIAHILFNQLEGRTNGPDNAFRWDMEAWVGTDMNKLVLKSEGFLENGRASDGITELMYARPLPFLRYLDAQVGLRYDLDSYPGLLWGAIGIEGLAPNFFQVEPTFYFTDRGRVAGRLNASYDLLITNRLILQPQVELNFYSQSDPSRGLGAGLSELDSGLRLRYEFSRKFGPYIGVTYTGAFGETADLTRADGGIVNDVRFVFGLRVWY